MAWYPLPQSAGTPSAGDEFFDDQSAGWPLWSFGSADDVHDSHSAGGVRAVSSDEQTEGPPVPQQRTQPTDDIFMSQFSDEEMRKMDAPFEALDMFPGSMHRLLSYENMLGGVLTGSEDQLDASLGLGVDTMDTCGFPLFSHDLMQNRSTNAPTEVVPDLTPKDWAGASFRTKRSRPVADEGSLFFEALVLEELEDVVFQLTKRTRVCFRDAFFRLAESSRAKCSAANGTPSSQTGVQQAAEGNASSRISTPVCPERETNAIDRTVADLTMKPPRPIPLEVLVSRCADDSGAEAQSATSSWTTTA